MVESGKLKLLAQHVVNLTYRTLNARCEVLSSSFLERIESLCFWLELSCSLFFGGLFGQASKGSGAQASGCLAPWIGSSWAGRGPWCWCGTKWPGVFQLDGFFGTWRCWEWGVVLMWCCQFVVYVFTSALFYAFPFGDVHRNFNLKKKKQHVQVGTCRIHLRKHLTRRPSLHPLGLIPMLRSGGYTSEFSFWPCSCCNMFCFPRQLTADRLMKRQKHPLMSSLMVSELVPRKCLMPRSGCSACSLLGIGTCKFVQLTPHQTSTTYLGPLIGIGR